MEKSYKISMQHSKFSQIFHANIDNFSKITLPISLYTTLPK